MSLTSYRAAPPRVTKSRLWFAINKRQAGTRFGWQPNRLAEHSRIDQLVNPSFCTCEDARKVTHSTRLDGCMPCGSGASVPRPDDTNFQQGTSLTSVLCVGP